MRIHTTTLTLIAAAGLFGCGKATQPKPACRTQNNTYAARFLEPQPTGACDGKIMEGEILHLAYYRSAPQGGIPKVGIESSVIADAVQAAEHAEPPVPVTRMPQEYSLGSFSAVFPDDKDECQAPTLTEAGVKIDAIPANPATMAEARPAVDLKYKWSKVRFITQPLSNAIHFGADLERTDGDCTVKYKVAAINPVIHCGDGKKMEKDDMGVEHEVDAPELGNPVQEKCAPSKVGAASGTGLSPHFVYECLPAPYVFCAPSKKFPARK